MQVLSTQPRDWDFLLVESRSEQQRIMSTLLELNHDLRLQNADLGGGLNKIPKKVARGGTLVSIANLRSQESIEATGHQSQLQITIDLHRHSRRQSIHVKEINPIGNPVLDDHTLGIALDQLRRRRTELIGDQDRRLLMAQVLDRHLSYLPVIPAEFDLLIQNLRCLVETRHPFELNPPPGREGLLMNPMDHLLGTSPKGDKSDPHLIEFVQMSIGGQFGIKDQFLRKMTRPLLPEGHKTENLIVLFLFAQLPVGIAEDLLPCIVGQKSQNALLTAAPFGDIMLLHQGVFPVKRNGMKIQMKRSPPLQPQPSYGIKPPSHEMGIRSRINPATILGEEGPFGNGIEPGKKGKPFIHHMTHHMAVPRIAKQFQSQKGQNGLRSR